MSLVIIDGGLDESDISPKRIKQLLGSDPITYRELYQTTKQFVPNFDIIICTNANVNDYIETVRFPHNMLSKTNTKPNIDHLAPIFKAMLTH